ncbi:tyrosine-type recombinase/integrase [Alphaproteobacteria bacterium]|nr:tyrosine-type recombinase/integrase [Alphaproteobacteria bacterium]
MGFVVKRGENYSARLAIPKALRPILGQNEFKKSLGTTSKKEAELLAAPLVLRWKKLIEEARVDGATAKAKALHRALSDTKASDLIDEDGAMEVVRGIIIEEAIEKTILGGRDINSIDTKSERAAAKAFYDIASGQVITLDDYVDGWVASISHLKPRTINQMQRDVVSFLKEETSHIPTRETMAAWIRASKSTGAKFIKRKLGSLGSFWEYLLVEGVVTDLSPFHGHKLPRDVSKTKPIRRAFSNDECLALMAEVASGKDTALADLITLGLYTGARIEELCRLRVDDIITEDNHRALRIDKSKTQAGTRTVPLHPAITVLVDRLAADSKDGYLVFSKSKNQYDERSTGLSRRFGRLKSSLGYGPELVFHSLRKTVTTKLEQAGVSEGIAADIVGHEKQTITYGLYSGGTSMAQKMEAISKINY